MTSETLNKGRYPGWTTTATGEWVKKLPRSGYAEGADKVSGYDKTFYSATVFRARDMLMAKYKFTAKEIEIICHLVDGRSNKAICERLNRNVKTVKFHMTSIMKKLNVLNRTQAIVCVVRDVETSV